MTHEDMDPLVKLTREEYNAPPETPREEMWAVIRAGMAARTPDVVPIRRARGWRAAFAGPAPGWAAAAAAVLVLGIGIGRWTSPGPGPDATLTAAAPDEDVMLAATRDHLRRTESLLTMVQSDSRTGAVDPSVGVWAGGLLTRTRLLLDANSVEDPTTRELLEDVELVLMQIVGAASADGDDGERTRSELTLAIQGMDDKNVLSRMQVASATGVGLAGT